jgi:hypothetical protein
MATTDGTTATTARALTAASVLLSAVVHLELWAQGMREVPIIGPGFLLNAIGGLVIALAVLLWDHVLPLLASIAFGASTLGAYVLAVTVGLFGVRERVGGVAATLAAVAEVAAIVFALAAILTERRRRRSGARPRVRIHGRGVTPPRPARP